MQKNTNKNNKITWLSLFSTLIKRYFNHSTKFVNKPSIKTEKNTKTIPTNKHIKKNPITYKTIVQEQKVQPSSTTKFMCCPIGGKDSNGYPLTHATVKISAVLDHSGTAIDTSSSLRWGKNAKNQKVEAFNGEVGEGEQCSQEPCGYPKKDTGAFFENKKEINYVGVSYDGGKHYLQYDGHAGYDFPYPEMTPVLAPANGKLYKAVKDKDKIYGGMWGNEKGNFRLDNSFYIEHECGFVTWFRHCVKLHDDIEKQIENDFSKHSFVQKGQTVAYVGRVGTRAIHLHFEVRGKSGEIIDPYKDNLWAD